MAETAPFRREPPSAVHGIAGMLPRTLAFTEDTMPDAQLQDTVFDAHTAAAFNERIAGVLDHGAAAVMLSIGHRTGLFDVMSDGVARTSSELAAAGGFAERYVREWLNAMTTAGVVRYDPATARYVLPAEHAASLTRGAPLGNLAVYAQMVAMMGAVERPIVERFRTGEGTAYGDYPCFHEVMAEDSGQTVVDALFDTVLPLVPGLAERLERGIDVLDAGCGRGLALMALARRYPASRFTGYDLCTDAIAFARGAAADLDNVRFEAKDLADFAEVERYDLVTSFDAVHDQRSPGDILRRLHRSLRPRGIHLMQDIAGSARLENNLDFPLATFLYAISCVHCTPVSLGQGGEGLGTMWGWETARAMLEAAGYARIERHVFEHDPMNVWFVATKAG
jgi:2-polyprenyl-3-methyl-5-hydroxy-6-metoxy-1,4-benzoquinol methylase